MVWGPESRRPRGRPRPPRRVRGGTAAGAVGGRDGHLVEAQTIEALKPTNEWFPVASPILSLSLIDQ